MISKDIEHRVVKFLNHSATMEDLELLEVWIKNFENKEVLKSFIKTHYQIQLTMHDPNSEELEKRLLNEIRKRKRMHKVRSINSFMKYAAIIILIISVGYLSFNQLKTNGNEEIIVPSEDAITLELGNGAIKTLTPEGNSQIVDEVGNEISRQVGSKIKYAKNDEMQSLRFNTLKIPFGKTFQLELSDGTNVVLNSGSSLKYPVNFIEGKGREVILEGEGFFDVAHDPLHPFVVRSNEINVKVLGTKFNLSNYQEDIETEVVLVQGAVSVDASQSNSSRSNNKMDLTPGDRGVFNKLNKGLSKSKVNVDLYTSWLDGNIVIRDQSFENIIRKLERAYNVVIINNNKQLAREKFNATIETKRETIEEVFDYFDKVYGVDYRVISNKIIIE